MPDRNDWIFHDPHSTTIHPEAHRRRDRCDGPGGFGTHRGHGRRGRRPRHCRRQPRGTATPIKHVVVILQENVSFDHYFATCWWSFHEFVLPFEDVTLLSAAPSRSWVGPPPASGRSHRHSQPGGVCQGHVGGVPFMMLVFASSLSLLSGLCFQRGWFPARGRWVRQEH
jgi:hypothetical protein